MWLKDSIGALLPGQGFQGRSDAFLANVGAQSYDSPAAGGLKLGSTWLADSSCAELPAGYGGGGCASFDESCYVLAFPCEPVRLKSAGVQHCFQAGEPFIYCTDAAEALTGQVEISVTIPAAELRRQVPPLQRPPALALNPASPVVQMLWRYCSESLTLGQYIGERQGRLFSEQIISLLSLELNTLLNVGEVPVTDMTAVHRGRIFDLINAEYSDAELTLSRLCQRLHLSRRYVQRILARHGTSFSDYLRTVRLEAAAVQLSHARPPLRLAQLAEDCGFKSQSSFNRAFRRHFGQTPRAYHAKAVTQREL